MLTLAGLAAAGCNSDSLSEGIRPSPLVANQPAPQPRESVGSETALAPEQPASPSSAAVAASSNAPERNQQVAALPRVAPVAFLPVTGAPQTVVSRLASAMRSAARDESVPVVVSIQQGAQYQVKGYFSALGDKTGSTLV